MIRYHIIISYHLLYHIYRTCFKLGPPSLPTWTEDGVLLELLETESVQQDAAIISSPFNRGIGHGRLGMASRGETAKTLKWPLSGHDLDDLFGSPP